MVTIDLSYPWEEPDLRADPASLVLLRVMIGAYRQCSLPEGALSTFGEALNWFRSQRKMILLRCVYDLDGKGMEHDPLSLALLIQHIGQLSAVISEFSDVVWLYQGLLIGSWGEMHNSRYVTPDHMLVLHRQLAQSLPESIYLAVRKPAQWRMLHAEGTSDRRTGLFNDAMFGSDTELGTFGARERASSDWQDQWLPEEELAFEAGINERTPFGGEVVDGLAVGISADEMLARLRSRRVTYLNREWDPKVLTSWRKRSCEQPGIWTDANFYEYLDAHLGYRFVVSDVRSALDLLGRARGISFTVTNTGTARMHLRGRLFFCHMDHNGAQTRLELTESLSDLGPGESRQIQCRLKTAAGKVWLLHRTAVWDMPIAFGNAEADENGDVLLGEYR